VQKAADEKEVYYGKRGSGGRVSGGVKGGEREKERGRRK